MQSEGWERVYREKGDLRLGVLPRIPRAAKMFKEQGYEKVLDLACGTGKHSLYLAKKGFTVYATDIAPSAIEIAREKARNLRLDIDFRVHDMQSIPFNDGFFDAVICTWSIHHGTVAQIQQTIAEIYRVLRPGGTVLTDLPAAGTWDYMQGREIEPDTYIEVNDEERDVPHHYTTREEVLRFFGGYSNTQIRLAYRRSTQVEEDGEIHRSRMYNVLAVK